MDKELIPKNHFHFIGVGGIGMSAIAMGLLKKGYSVSGSDLVKNDETKKLEKLGAIIFNSQIKQNIEFVISKFDNKLINFVVSTAIKPDNDELRYCREKNLPVKHRSEILALLMQSYTSLAVAGSHGKTSTSTFLSTLLEKCTHSSSSITGGIIPPVIEEELCVHNSRSVERKVLVDVFPWLPATANVV